MWHRCPYRIRSGARQNALKELARVDRFKALMLADQGKSFVYWQQNDKVWISEGIIGRMRHWRSVETAAIGVFFIACWSMAGAYPVHHRPATEAASRPGDGGRPGCYGWGGES